MSTTYEFTPTLKLLAQLQNFDAGKPGLIQEKPFKCLILHSSLPFYQKKILKIEWPS